MRAQKAGGMLQSGASAPDIDLPDLTGHRINLKERLKTAPVLLAFFKISCPTCQLTFPYLQRLADGAGPDAPQLIAVSQDDASATREFQSRFGISMPALVDDPKAWPASNAYRITSVPSLFLVEPDGRISLAIEGFSKAGLESLGKRFQTAPFRPDERVPELRPG